MAISSYSAIGVPEVAATPANPASGQVEIYAKGDHRVYTKDSTGVEYGPVASSVGVPYYHVKTYGAKMNVVRLTDGAMTSGQATLTSATATFTAADVGKLVQVLTAAGSGNPLLTTISSVTDGTHAVLAANAGATVSAVTFMYGTDDTTAFTNAIAAALAAGGGIVYFPPGTAFTGQLTLYSRVHLVGSGMGTTVLTLKYSQYVDFVISNGFAALIGGVTGGGVLQCGVRHLTLDGNRACQRDPMTTPAAPTVAASITGGTLVAATYNYQVARLSANGETLASASSANAVVASGTTGSVTVTFPATVSGQTGWRVRGRTYPYNKIIDVGLVATYVDTGSITPAGNPISSAADAGRGLAVFGYNYVVFDVCIRNTSGDGYYSEWANTETMSDALNDWMETFVSDMKIHDCGGTGMAWNGPHDSVLSRIIVAFCSAANSNTLPGFHCIGNGYSSIFGYCHAFGNHSYAWWCEGNFYLMNCVGEGAATAQLYSTGDGIFVHGGSYFAGGVSAATGILIGNAGYQPANSYIRDVKVTGFTTGPSVNWTFAGAGTTIYAWIVQVSGTAYVGTVPTDADIDAVITGGSTTPSIKQLHGKVISAVVGIPVATAAASAGTSPPAPVLAANSTDTKGSATFGTGTGSPGTAGYLTLTFSSVYPRIPAVVVCASNQATAVKQPYVQAVSATAVTIGLGVAGAASQANTIYGVEYIVVG